MKEQEKEKKEKKWIDFLLIIIIIVLLILLFWFGYRLKSYMRMNNSNGDVFEINCECGSATGNLEVSDSELVWDEENELQIFKNPVYKMKKIIAPGSTNSYQFYIKNQADCNIDYELTFEEDNPYDINMKYRLKVNDQPISDEWVSITDIARIVQNLNHGEEDNYYLEWKWFEGDNDTEIGSNIKSYYHLSIQIVGKQLG